MKSRLLAPLLLLGATLHAADTLRVNLRQADSLFLASNYRLLTAALNVDAQRAQIVQARLYPNPVVFADFNLLDPENEKALHIGRTGQKALQVEQLILLGGKRQAQVDLAKTNAELAELELEDLTRQLRFELRKSYFAVGRHIFLLDRYTRQLEQLDTLISAYSDQAAKGNVALKDLVRLKSEYLGLVNVRAQIFEALFAEQGTLQMLLRTDRFVLPDTATAAYNRYVSRFDDAFLLDAALSARPDYRATERLVVFSNQNTRLQRALAKPDVSVFGAYDQRSGAFVNQVNIGASMPLPMWNRNQGNIQAAKIGEQMAALGREELRTAIAVEIANRNRAYEQALAEYRKMLEVFNADYDRILEGMTDNFTRGNVNLIEFLDFFQAYNEALGTVSDVRQQLGLTAEYLNFLTATELFQ
ncbi:MAG: TolC family protein [Saprospiraceae bacterium]|nr:TolC family protein [Saprospiraceae bacterium]